MSYGDVRDRLVELPHDPWDGFGGSYVESDIFPVKAEIIAKAKPRRVFEFGAFFGYFLCTAVDAAPGLEAIGWIDPEVSHVGSNELAVENIRSMGYEGEIEFGARTLAALEFGEADLVHADGAHDYASTTLDLYVALELRPRLILVDDYSAIADVREATDAFAAAKGWHLEERATVNGLAVLSRGKAG